jgi:hypothetical protein
MYNYRINITRDILDHIRWNYNAAVTAAKLQEDREEWEQELYDVLWTTDSVTGNASGSYYCNSYKAQEALMGNWYLLAEALREFGCEGINAIEKGPEWCDVTVRCYLLGECISAALDELEEETEGGN